MRFSLALTVLIFALPGAGLRAQSTSASLAGRVSDPSKARIVGAAVATVNPGTKVRYESTSDASGEYFLTNLPPGRYRMEVEMAGFKNVIQPEVILHVQDSLDLDFEMEVGPASESITVQGYAPSVNTDSATVSTGPSRMAAKTAHDL
jgi:hypothetical protein